MTPRKLKANSNILVYQLKGNWKRRKKRYTKLDSYEPVCMCCGYPETIERLMKE